MTQGSVPTERFETKNKTEKNAKMRYKDSTPLIGYSAERRRLGFRFCAAKNEQPGIGPELEPGRQDDHVVATTATSVP